MKNINIKVNSSNSYIYLDKSVLGINAENLQGSIIFEFVEDFIDGVAWLEIKKPSGETGYINLEKENETYTMPILSSLLEETGSITMQLRITESEDERGIPVFKSNIFYLEVLEALNVTEEIPEEYPSWIEIADAKINEMNKALEKVDNLDIDAEKVDNVTTVTITDKEGSTKQVEILDGENGEPGKDGIDGEDAKINGYNTVEIKAGDNVVLEQKDNVLSINSKMYDDLEIRTEISSLNEIVSDLDKDVINIENDISRIDEDILDIDDSLNHLDDIKADKTQIPDVSQFITKSVNNLVNYYNKTETYTQTEVNELIGAIKTLKIEIVDNLPETGESNIIYLVPSQKTTAESIYDEYIYINGSWEMIGSTAIDLADYYTKEDINALLLNYVTSSDIEEKLKGYVKSNDYATKDNAGIIKVDDIYNVSVDNGAIHTNSLTQSQYEEKANDIFISKGILENIKNAYVKDGLVNNNVELTDEEKIKIETWLGLPENYLTYYNEIPYTVSGQYNPTTKKYVDEADNSLREKISEIELSKFPNATIIGTPTIQQGQVSDFSLTDYLEFPFLVDFRGRPFEINFAFTTSQDVDNQQNILDSDFGLAFAIRNKHLVLALSFNGSSWATEQIGSLILQPQITYRIKITWNGLLYRVQYSLDGGNTYIDDITFGSTQSPYPKQMYIGTGKLARNYFKGIINMNYADVSVNGNKIWLGMDDAGLALRMSVSMDNIDSVGIQRVKDIASEVIPDTKDFATKTDLNKKANLSGADFTGNITTTGIFSSMNIEGGSNNPTHKFAGGIGIGDALGTQTARYYVFKRGGSKNYLYTTTNSIGYDPIKNVSSTEDYGMKLEVKVLETATEHFPWLSGGYKTATFYLSHTGCTLCYSGDAKKSYTQEQVYKVIDSGNLESYVTPIINRAIGDALGGEY